MNDKLKIYNFKGDLKFINVDLRILKREIKNL